MIIPKQYQRNFYTSYGRLGNRPIEEIEKLANKEKLHPEFNCRFVDNVPNNRNGYIHAYKAGLLASIDRSTPEVHFEQMCEIRVANLAMSLEAKLKEVFNGPS